MLYYCLGNRKMTKVRNDILSIDTIIYIETCERKVSNESICYLKLI